MAQDKIQIYAGKKANIPTLLYRELGYCTDTQELYIGTGTSNVLIGAVTWGADINTLRTNNSRLADGIEMLNDQVAVLESIKLTANQAGYVDSLSSGATLTDVITTVNTILSKLQAAGIMEE